MNIMDTQINILKTTKTTKSFIFSILSSKLKKKLKQ